MAFLSPPDPHTGPEVHLAEKTGSMLYKRDLALAGDSVRLLKRDLALAGDLVRDEEGQTRDCLT
jgi:hypothetical protein